MPIQIPQAVQAGLVNPAAGAWTGLANMYGMAEEDLNLRTNELRRAMQENTLANAYKDNPVLQGNRDIALLGQGVEKEEFGSGRRAKQAQAATEAATDTSEAQSSAARIQKSGEQATGLLQAQEMVKQWQLDHPGETAGKSLSFDKFWTESVHPHLTKFNINLGERSSPEGLVRLTQLAPGALQTQQHAQAMALQAPRLQNQLDVANIQAAPQYAHQQMLYDIQRDFPSMDRTVAMAYARLRSGQGTPMDKELVDSWFAKQQYPGIKDSRGVQAAEFALSQAKEALRRDPSNPKLQRDVQAAQDDVDQARQAAAAGGQPRPEPKTPEAPKAAPHPLEGQSGTLNGKHGKIVNGRFVPDEQ